MDVSINTYQINNDYHYYIFRYLGIHFSMSPFAPEILYLSSLCPFRVQRTRKVMSTGLKNVEHFVFHRPGPVASITGNLRVSDKNCSQNKLYIGSHGHLSNTKNSFLTIFVCLSFQFRQTN